MYCNRLRLVRICKIGILSYPLALLVYKFNKSRLSIHIIIFFNIHGIKRDLVNIACYILRVSSLQVMPCRRASFLFSFCVYICVFCRCFSLPLYCDPLSLRITENISKKFGFPRSPRHRCE